MSNEILINVTPMETRVALVENGILQEMHLERTLKRGIVGNIYKGQVVRVLPGMQAAFIDIGLEKAAFIHISELFYQNAETPEEDITKLLKNGQSLIVQVIKDPIGTKGARLTTQLSLPSRFLVYIPYTNHIGISVRIEDEMVRERLRQTIEECVIEENQGEIGGFIVRTAAESANKEELLTDIHYLRRLWGQIKEHITTAGFSSLIYEDLSLSIRALRDLMTSNIHRVYIDSQESFIKAKSFSEELMPELTSHLKHYQGETPLFEIYGIEQELQKALYKKVSLKSGGYLVIDQTEAMTTIDVNTGGFVGHKNFEETIFKTNLEAATAIARQLRLRNLGGIIIVDFIDMIIEEHRQQVLQTLQKELEKDHSKTNVLGFTELGLVQMTRKRTRESLEQTLCEPCLQCQGTGTIKTPETVCYEILREIIRISKAYPTSRYMVLANPKIVDRLLDEESNNVADLEAFIGKTIIFQADNLYVQDQYDVVPQ